MRTLSKKLYIYLILLICLYIGFTSSAFADPVPLYPVFSIEGLFQNHGTVMLLIDTQTMEIVYANSAALEFYGYPGDTLLGKKITDINISDDAEKIISRNQALNLEKNFFTFTHRLYGGDVREVDVYTYPYESPSGSQLLFSIIHDVTPRVEAQRRADLNRAWVLGIIGLSLAIATTLIVLLFSSKERIEKQKEHLGDLFQNMQESFASFKVVFNHETRAVDYTLIECNAAYEKYCAMTKEQMFGNSVSELFPKMDPRWYDAFERVMMTGQPYSLQIVSKATGRYFQANCYKSGDSEISFVLTDVTAQVSLSQKIRRERALYESMLLSLGDAMISTDREGRILMINAIAEKLTGWTSFKARGKHYEEVLRIVPHVDLLSQVADSKSTSEVLYDIHLQSKEGTLIPIACSMAPLINSDGQRQGMIIVFRDYSERRQQEEAIRYLSYHDYLTGLYNRRFFEEELRRLDHARSLPLSLIMIDVNGLKLTNDAFGHIVGDALLVQVADVLNASLRQTDIIARMGGDEFVVLLPNTPYHEGQRLVARILEEAKDVTHQSVPLSISVGLSTKESSEQSMTQIFSLAEEQMYSKKLVESQVMRQETVRLIIDTLVSKSPVEKKHAHGVSQISVALAQAFGLTKDTVLTVEKAAMMHDIGKIVLEDTLLKKQGVYTEDEQQKMRKHAEAGYQILKSVDSYNEFAEYALSHHERYDGGGYPRRIKGEEIPLIARIISIADAYDSMKDQRYYKPALSDDEILEELLTNSGTQFDPHLLSIFVSKVLPTLVKEQN